MKCERNEEKAERKRREIEERNVSKCRKCQRNAEKYISYILLFPKSQKAMIPVHTMAK